jgi:nitrite reductase (NO-forming)
MEGQFTVTPRLAPQTVVEADISREPADLPPPIGKRDPQTVRVDLLSAEVEGRLAEGTTFGYWTFNGKVPGPFIRVRVGDTVDIHLKNSGDSAMMHSVDFHATTGPGGGAAVLQVEPGKEKAMTWKALVPGSTSITARRRWLPSTSPMACTASSWSNQRKACPRWTASFI